MTTTQQLDHRSAALIAYLADSLVQDANMADRTHYDTCDLMQPWMTYAGTCNCDSPADHRASIAAMIEAVPLIASITDRDLSLRIIEALTGPYKTGPGYPIIDGKVA